MLTFIIALVTQFPAKIFDSPGLFIGSAFLAAMEFLAEMWFLIRYFG